MQRVLRLTLAALAALVVLPVEAGGAAQDYMLYCMGCHGDAAQGVAGKVPRLAGNLPLYMRTAAGRNYVLRVPGAANSVLPDERITAVLNWLAVTYPADGAAPLPFTVAEVTAARHTPLANVQETRQQVVRALAASGPAPAVDY